MKIHVAQANGLTKSTLHFGDVLASHARATSGLHTLTDDAAVADLILIVGDIPSLAHARQVELLRRFPEKAMVYTEIDQGLAFAPGIYGSATTRGWFNRGRTRSFVYLSSQGSVRNKEVAPRPSTPKSLLFSFRGKRNCRVRFRLFDHDFQRDDVLVTDTSDYFHWSESKMDRQFAQREYADHVSRSHFALCPRGVGFGSIRLFEVMEMGVAPVMLADRYTLPEGPDWDSFLLRVPESRYAELPAILTAHAAESAERGRKAREAWEMYFAPEVAFDRMVEQLVAIREQRAVSEAFVRRLWPVIELYANMRPRLVALLRQAIATARRQARLGSPRAGRQQA